MNKMIAVSPTDEVARFAPSELLPLKKGDRRYLFDDSHEALKFIEGCEANHCLDENQCMVLQLSTDLKWAVTFELKYPESAKWKSPVLENPPDHNDHKGSSAEYAQ